MRYINLNGKIVASDDCRFDWDNGAFRFGYGLFETMLVENGEIEMKKYHWERLADGLKVLCLKQAKLASDEWIEEQVLRTVSKNNLEQRCRVRMTYFATGRGIFETGDEAGFVIECFPLEKEVLELNESGLVAGFAEGLNKSINNVANIKSSSALIYALAAKQARSNKWNDALISNSLGNVIESTISNFFWIKSGQLFTPPLSDGCIAGVMRRYIAEKVDVREKSATREDVLNADEVFLTNSIRRIRWIGSIENRQFNCHQMRSIYKECFPVT